MVYNLTIKYQAPDHRSQQRQYQLMIVLRGGLVLTLQLLLCGNIMTGRNN